MTVSLSFMIVLLLSLPLLPFDGLSSIAQSLRLLSRPSPPEAVVSHGPFFPQHATASPDGSDLLGDFLSFY